MVESYSHLEQKNIGLKYRWVITGGFLCSINVTNQDWGDSTLYFINYLLSELDLICIYFKTQPVA
jgi:hypothetical protein